MVLVPAGQFWMGSDDGNDDEKPRHRVDLDAYYIDRYEITNGFYQHFMEATNRPGPRKLTRASCLRLKLVDDQVAHP